MNPDNLLSYHDISEILNIKESTLRTYQRRGYMPPPDVMLADRPRWYPTTVEHWIRKREVGANEKYT